MMKPLVSIIVPIYKVEEYLNRCVDSIIKQTYQNLEIILVNDGSPDKCLEICYEYEKQDKRIIVIDKPNGGVSSARNAALKIFKGDYVCFIDSDDYLASNYVAKFIDLYEKNPELDLIEMHQAEDKNGVLKHRPYQSSVQINNHNLLAQKELLLKIGSNVCVKCYRRSLIKECYFPEGLVNEDDYYTTIMYPKLQNVLKLDGEFDYFYYIRSNSLTHVFKDQIFDMFEIYQRIITYYKNNLLFDSYHDVLEAKTARSLLVTTISHRMAFYQGKTNLKAKYHEMLAFLNQEFPNWEQNPYLSKKDLKLAKFVSQSYFNCQLLWVVVRVSGK